jgi:hypothetical protein
MKNNSDGKWQDPHENCFGRRDLSTLRTLVFTQRNTHISQKFKCILIYQNRIFREKQVIVLKKQNLKYKNYDFTYCFCDYET